MSEVQGLRHCQAKPSTNCTAGRQAARHLKAGGGSHTSDNLTKPPKASQKKNNLKHSLDVASKVAYHMNMSSHIQNGYSGKLNRAGDKVHL